ncbi:MAG: hypothetical protein ABS99_02495 [Acetobacteraceae bacterium SCN 69-10]|nr:MAG: hypothetical protein ABS99_02495 [Acetobacteraceae bacterium SCN 69-10]
MPVWNWMSGSRSLPVPVMVIASSIAMCSPANGWSVPRRYRSRRNARAAPRSRSNSLVTGSPVLAITLPTPGGTATASMLSTSVALPMKPQRASSMSADTRSNPVGSQVALKYSCTK